ncbi:MAG: hypothetical protein HGB37_00015 [Candidatus Moranbacteria bacterium]|nr:hypothetical protein [Candidatus Moranbacteria bacterium]
MKRIILTVSLLLAFLCATPAHAAGELVLNPSGDHLFNVKDMAPGQSVTKEITVTNTSKDKADIFLNVENVQGNRLADVLDFTLIDKDTDEYFIGGPGNEYTLRDLGEEGNVFIERLKGKGSNSYLITLTFDTNVGNRYQNLSTKFDLMFRLTANPAKPGSDPPCRTDRCRDRWEHERGDNAGSHSDDNWWKRTRDAYQRALEILWRSWRNRFRD